MYEAKQRTRSPGEKKRAAWEGKVTITWSPKRGFLGNLFFLSIKCTLFIPSFNVLSGYCNVKLNLVAALTV